MEDEEALEARARVREAAQAVEDRVDKLLSDLRGTNKHTSRLARVPARGARPQAPKRGGWERKSATHGVVSTRVVVRGILLARDERLRVEESLVGSGADLVDHSRLEVDVDRARDVLAL